MLILLGCSVFTFASTRQDLEQIQSELRNPITLESIDSILLESGSHFEKTERDLSKPHRSCLFYTEELPIYISAEFDHVATNLDSYKEKKLVRKIKYGPNDDHPAHRFYRFENGRFQYNDDPYRPNDKEKRTEISDLIEKSNSILDKIDQLKLTCMSYPRCEGGAFQGLSLYQVSDMLGSRGICGDLDSNFKICNYRVELEDKTTADIAIEYVNSIHNHDDADYATLFMGIKDAQKNSTEKADSVKTVKIGKQEWMDRNQFYGENAEESWHVFMVLHLRQDGYDFIEKPDIKNNHQGAYPAGFHVPTRKEWKELFSFVAKDQVKFLKYDLFDEYKKARDALPSYFELAFASASELKKYHK